jgi:D-aminopeptidase
MQKRTADYGITVGEMPKGAMNKISDVPGVRVGHCTVDTESHKTGVTVVLPGENFIFSHKLPAAVYVLNGYGKSLGLMQVEELGSLETPIFLTNTLNVGLVHDAAVGIMLAEGARRGIEIASINPLVFECNDAYLNDIGERAVTAAHVAQAMETAEVDFREGDVGAGKGMSCHQLKGGIGSASRVFTLDQNEYTLGVLVLSNHGALHDLTIGGKAIGKMIETQRQAELREDKGSIILVYATDAPLTSRQLRRVIKRGAVGLARLGSFIGESSGDVMFGFSTGYSVSGADDILQISMVNEKKLDTIFRAAAECAEEAVLNSMICAERVVGYRGRMRESLVKYLALLGDS